MTEKKKNGKSQATSTNSAIASTTPANNEANDRKKNCPALYPSKPHTSNK